MPKTREFLTIEQALAYALKDLTDLDLSNTKKKKMLLILMQIQINMTEI